MRRREFIGVFGGALVARPDRALSQQAKVPVIGFLRSTSAVGSSHLVDAFRAGLKEAGFVDGQNVAIEYRWADNRLDRLPELAADLVRSGVAVIIGNAVSVQAAMAATTKTPIVFVAGVDPVKTGLVPSLNRPDRNVTGVIFDTVELAAKRLGLLRELLPGTSRVGVVLDPTLPDFQSEMDAEQAAGSLGSPILVLKAATDAAIDVAFAAFAQSDVGAVLIGSGPVFLGQRHQIVALAARQGLPASYVTRDYVEAGGLMSYGPSQTDAYRRGGVYAGRILKGAKPGELPVERPTKFELVINAKTARALGLAIPPTLLARADEVIE
jgi:putative tryptophan/tyrosine transport system substrate-binding protein